MKIRKPLKQVLMVLGLVSVILGFRFLTPASIYAQSPYTCATPVRIMPLGNSITMGDFSGVADNDKKVSYRKYLWESLQTGGHNVDFVGSLVNGEFYQPSDGFDPDHEGHSGWYDHEIATHIYNGLNDSNNGHNWLQNYPADIILLHIGTNGIDPDSSDVEDILNEIDQYETDNNVEVTVIVARIIRRIDYNHTKNDNLLTTQFNDNVETLVLNRIANGDNLIMVDMEDGAGFIYDYSHLSGDLWDDLHPYDTGYQKMSVVWYNALTGLLPVCNLAAPQITSTPNTTGSVGSPYNYDVEATGNPTPTYNLTTFPAGMSINTTSGLIQWSPLATGSFSVTVEAINSVDTVSQTFTISVTTPPVNVTTSAVGGGSVTKTPNQTNYSLGEVVTLTATANPGYTFTGWSGDLTGNTNPDTITLDSDKAVTGTFTVIPYTVVTDTVGMGQITLTPGQATYTYNDVITATATAAPGRVFTGWSGDLLGTTNPAAMTITGNKVITANFSAVFSLTVTAAPVAGGDVTRFPNKVNYDTNEVVVLTATANSGYTFTGWSGDLIDSTNPVSVTMASTKVITANFSPVYNLTVNTSPVAGGNITITPNKLTYTDGETVTLTATVNSGYTFAGWSGDLSETAISQVLTMNSDKVVTATFTQSPAPSSNNIFLPLIRAYSSSSSSASSLDLVVDSMNVQTTYDGVLESNENNILFSISNLTAIQKIRTFLQPSQNFLSYKNLPVR